MMAAEAFETKELAPSSGQFRCWVESAILGLGIPSTIWAISRLISTSIPAAVHGPPEQRFFFWLVPGVLVEWLFVLGLWLVLRRRALSFKALGVWRLGTWPAWAVALLLASLSIASNLRFLPRMHIPVSSAFVPHGFHLTVALTMGITAGFCEEVLFRAFLMTEFAKAGHGKVMQVFVPGLSFGLAHAGYLNQGLLVWLGIMLPTALLGMMWGIAYLLGRRSLVPPMVAHFLNDATALPWILFFMVTTH
jgi:membrane protease YdiL (CAAX protease family)